MTQDHQIGGLRFRFAYRMRTDTWTLHAETVVPPYAEKHEFSNEIDHAPNGNEILGFIELAKAALFEYETSPIEMSGSN